jgi:hypothetical protein
MSQVGTKAQLGQWLSRTKSMTYTRYSHLPTAEKLAIQKEYSNKGVKRESGQSSASQEGASATV